MKIQVNLTKEEYHYLMNYLLKDHQEILSKLEFENNNINCINLYLDEDVADHIRELTENKIGMNCFDENYEPTEEGWILEHFIDKFYIG